jgi:hypothetical protein
MNADVDLGSYSAESGLRLTWVPGYKVRVAVTDGEVLITANQQGLLSLAQHLLTLAQADVPSGVHAHMEPGLELEEDSTALILDKQ